MNAYKKYFPWTIRVLVSFLFIISAIAKMYPSPYFAISTFEVKQLYSLGFSEAIAPYFSRTLIGIEMALGLLLLQNNWLKKFIIPSTILLLAVFVGHLTFVTFLKGGNTGNCGCFGELIPMTPIQAIIKNIAAIGLLGYLYFLIPKENKNGNFWVLTTVLFATIMAIYMLAPIQPPAANFTVSPSEVISEPDSNETLNDTITSKELVTEKDTNKTIKKDSIVKTEVKINEPKKTKSGYANFFPKIDSGRKVLCFFVPGCDHCREVAKELNEMKQKDKNFPEIQVLFMNEEADLIPEFFKVAGTQYPYKIIEIIPFWKMLGTGKDTPGVKYLWNGNELKYYYGITDNKFNAAEFKELVNKPFADLKKK